MSGNPIKCLIVDDDELARELLETYVAKVDYLKWEGSFENPLDALSFLKVHPVDLLFLDIQMPEIKGTDFAGLLGNLNLKVVFTTAYSDYAIQGFELSAMDYLLKPITFNRFMSAVEKYPSMDKAAGSMSYVVIKSGYDFHRVSTNEILYIESDSEYAIYRLRGGGKIIANQSLRKLLTELPDTFMRVHRSFIVNGEQVAGLAGRELLLEGQNIPVSERYFAAVKEAWFS